MELYKAMRPKNYDEVVGQDNATQVLKGFLAFKKTPHLLMFTGPSGCGKTTLARIHAKNINCQGTDFQEMNAADFRGIDMVREVRSRMGLRPFTPDGVRVWLFDEAHKLTSDAQSALLKMFEDTPKHVYFMLATTDPNKLLKTIRTRATEIKTDGLDADMLNRLLQVGMEHLKISLADEVTDKIVEAADGSARWALVMLEKVSGLKDSDEQLAAIASGDAKAASIMICRAMLNPSTKWSEMVKILKGVDEEPENLRWMVLGYATSCALGGGKVAARAVMIIDAFSENFYDTKRAGLVRACYEVVCGA